MVGRQGGPRTGLTGQRRRRGGRQGGTRRRGGRLARQACEEARHPGESAGMAGNGIRGVSVGLPFLELLSTLSLVPEFTCSIHTYAHGRECRGAVRQAGERKESMKKGVARSAHMTMPTPWIQAGPKENERYQQDGKARKGSSRKAGNNPAITREIFKGYPLLYSSRHHT